MIWIILTYILSVILGWFYVHINYGKYGKDHGEIPNEKDLFLVFFPGINTIAAIIVWLFAFPIKFKSQDLSKFFKIKK